MLFLRGFISKPAERAQVLLKNGTKDFKYSPPFERLSCFYVTITGNFKVFNTLTSEPIYSKRKTFLKKLECRFLFESTRIENLTFSYKTALSEVNVKTNRMASTRWPYHKEQSLASNYFSFSKILFPFKGIVKRAEPCKYDILLVSRILWHKRITPSLKEWRFSCLIPTGDFPP